MDDVICIIKGDKAHELRHISVFSNQNKLPSQHLVLYQYTPIYSLSLSLLLSLRYYSKSIKKLASSKVLHISLYMIKGRVGNSVQGRTRTQRTLRRVYVCARQTPLSSGRRSAVIATTGSLFLSVKSVMAATKTKPFEGRFGDPNHPDGYRVVKVNGDKVSITGKDEKTDVKEGNVVGTCR